MAQEISLIVHEPDVTQKFLDAGFLPAGGSPVDFAALLHNDSARYAKIIKHAAIIAN